MTSPNTQPSFLALKIVSRVRSASNEHRAAQIIDTYIRPIVERKATRLDRQVGDPHGIDGKTIYVRGPFYVIRRGNGDGRRPDWECYVVFGNRSSQIGRFDTAKAAKQCVDIAVGIAISYESDARLAPLVEALEIALLAMRSNRPPSGEGREIFDKALPMIRSALASVKGE